MRTQMSIPLRFLHSNSANFTLPITRKSLPLAIYPFCIKKIHLDGVHHEPEREHLDSQSICGK